jgi:hypothetical protein
MVAVDRKQIERGSASAGAENLERFGEMGIRQEPPNLRIYGRIVRVLGNGRRL